MQNMAIEIFLAKECEWFCCFIYPLAGLLAPSGAFCDVSRCCAPVGRFSWRSQKASVACRRRVESPVVNMPKNVSVHDTNFYEQLHWRQGKTALPENVTFCWQADYSRNQCEASMNGETSWGLKSVERVHDDVPATPWQRHNRRVWRIVFLVYGTRMPWRCSFQTIWCSSTQIISSLLVDRWLAQITKLTRKRESDIFSLYTWLPATSFAAPSHTILFFLHKMFRFHFLHPSIHPLWFYPSIHPSIHQSINHRTWSLSSYLENWVLLLLSDTSLSSFIIIRVSSVICQTQYFVLLLVTCFC